MCSHMTGQEGEGVRGGLWKQRLTMKSEIRSLERSALSTEAVLLGPESPVLWHKETSPLV